jgi:UDP-N-acetylglucosamine--N-acetylmuramyl-(pentapeptide) pyrophosphoryl-undecaprenol N-acetylglucosamine transferase
VVPALAVADALREQGVEVTFIGGARAEATLVPAAGYAFEQISVEGLDRANPWRAARALARAAAATLRARRLLGALAPDAVLGAGGYVAGPVALAARSRGVPVVLTEADSHLGITNRILAPLARRVCLAFPLPGRDGGRYRVTGRPVPAGDVERDTAREQFGIAPGEACVLVFGGSLGARSINEAAIAAFAEATFEVLHVAGARDYPGLVGRVPGERYRLLEYLPIADFGAALAACDLVVARAGGSVFEIAAHGRPSILVPYPHAAADHQTANAAWMARAGAAIVIPDAQLTSTRLRNEVAALLADPSRLAAMAHAAQSLARPDAAQAVAGELLAAARR